MSIYQKDEHRKDCDLVKEHWMCIGQKVEHRMDVDG
jgi:hypothetical protein